MATLTATAGANNTAVRGSASGNSWETAKKITHGHQRFHTGGHARPKKGSALMRYQDWNFGLANVSAMTMKVPVASASRSSLGGGSTALTSGRAAVRDSSNMKDCAMR